jgi:hypothetical protein
MINLQQRMAEFASFHYVSALCFIDVPGSLDEKEE